VVIATDGLATGTRDASRISVLSTPALIVWLNVGVLAALAFPTLALATTAIKNKESMDLKKMTPGFLFVPTSFCLRPYRDCNACMY